MVWDDTPVFIDRTQQTHESGGFISECKVETVGDITWSDVKAYTNEVLSGTEQSKPESCSSSEWDSEENTQEEKEIQRSVSFTQTLFTF